MLLVLLSSSAYFYYNWQYFCLVKDLQGFSKLRIDLVVLSFIVNYGFFYLCSVWELHLVLNWSLFAFLLFFETLLYNHGDRRRALVSTLTGIISGLAMNIFCRSVSAMVMDQSLLTFNNHINSEGNLKGIPVFLGFLFSGIVVRLIRHPMPLEWLRLIMKHPHHQSFLLQIMVGLFFYLFLNLLLYSTPLNDPIIKIWSIKCCLFSVIGYGIAIWYTKRTCELDEYRDKNRHMRLQYLQQEQEQENLRRQATIDLLTGLGNRLAAEDRLNSLMEQGTAFTICFMDLDGLKRVNDHFGHDEGDHYIIMAAQEIKKSCRSASDELYRYGGDEFLMIAEGLSAEEILERSNEANYRLRLSESDHPYSMSLSFGAVESGGFSQWKDMVRLADEKMYELKLQKRVARIDVEMLD